MALDIDRFTDEVLKVVQHAVGSSIDPVLKRMDEFEARLASLPEPKDGADGKDADPVVVAALAYKDVRGYADEVKASLDEALAGLHKRLDDLPKPKDGKDGSDGKDADSSAIAEEVERSVLEIVERRIKEAVAEIPAGPEGTAGKDGEPGPQGEKGDAGPQGEKGDSGIDGKDGAPGERGEKGEKGLDGKDGADGRDGKDGADVTFAVKDADGHLHLMLSNGETKDVGRVVGHDGQKGINGKDGSDGLAFEDMEVEQDGRELVFRWARGEKSVEKRMTFAVPLDQGIFSAEKEYAPGDGVTYGGSFWIAQASTKEKPGTGGAWRLAVKKGRDGKDGVLKEAKPQAPIKTGGGK